MATAAEQFAEDYGYQLAFLKSDPELYAVFQKAMAGKWDATRFVAAVKASRWYKTHGEAYRQNLALKTTDPATWGQRVNSQYHTIGDLAASLGAQLTTGTLRALSEQSILMGWNDNQIRQVLSSHIKKGARAGQAGTIAQKIKETAFRNGVNLSEGFIHSWQKQIAEGATIEQVQQGIRKTYGTRLAPGFAKELEAGMDLYDIASPYMQTMAQTLELNPSDVDLFDPTIRKALGTSSDADGKPGSVPLWEFEQQLRQDQRWMKTKNAQDSAMAAGHAVLKDFGLVN
jgi:hypothetical protein